MKHSFSEKEVSALKIFAFLGIFFGIGADVIWFIGPFTGLPVHARISLTIKVAVILVQTISAFLVTLGFAWIYIRLKVNIWLSFVAGAILGALATAISFGLATGTCYAIGVPAGAIVINDLASNAFSGMQIFGQSFLKGSLFGAITGLLPGAITGTVLSLILGYKKEAQV